jgi:hypothetical protein
MHKKELSPIYPPSYFRDGSTELPRPEPELSAEIRRRRAPLKQPLNILLEQALKERVLGSLQTHGLKQSSSRVCFELRRNMRLPSLWDRSAAQSSRDRRE